MPLDLAIHVSPGVTIGVHTCSPCGERAVCAEVNASYVNGADLCGRCLRWLAAVVQENSVEAKRRAEAYMENMKRYRDADGRRRQRRAARVAPL